MGRGSRPIKRWRNDRKRKKKERSSGTRRRWGPRAGRRSRPREPRHRDPPLRHRPRPLDRLVHAPARARAGRAYDEGENAHSAFFVLEGQTFLVLTWDPERGREIGGSSGSSSPGTTFRPRSTGSTARASRAAASRRRASGPRSTTSPIPTATSSAHRPGVDAPRHRRRGLAAAAPTRPDDEDVAREADALALAGGELDDAPRRGSPRAATASGAPRSEDPALAIEEDRVDREAHEPHVNGGSGAKEDARPARAGTPRRPGAG